MRTYMLLLLASLLCSYEPLVAQSDITMRGKIKDERGEGIAFANIVLKQKGLFVKGTQSDFDGYYEIGPLKAGKYELEASYVGMMTLRVEDIVLAEAGRRGDELCMEIEKLEREEEVIKYTVPLIKSTPGQDDLFCGNRSSSHSLVTLQPVQGSVCPQNPAFTFDVARYYGTISDGLIHKYLHFFVYCVGGCYNNNSYAIDDYFTEPIASILTERKNRLATDRDALSPKSKLPIYDPLEGDDTLHY